MRPPVPPAGVIDAVRKAASIIATTNARIAPA